MSPRRRSRGVIDVEPTEHEVTRCGVCPFAAPGFRSCAHPEGTRMRVDPQTMPTACPLLLAPTLVRAVLGASRLLPQARSRAPLALPDPAPSADGSTFWVRAYGDRSDG